MATLRKGKLNVAKFKAVFDGIGEDAIKTAEQAGELILQNTLPLTPKDTGALRDSGKVAVKANTNKIVVTVSFGNNTNADYAAIVHEDLEPKKFTEEGTGPKYLEQGVNNSLDDLNKLFSDSLKNSLRKRSE